LNFVGSTLDLKRWMRYINEDIIFKPVKQPNFFGTAESVEQIGLLAGHVAALVPLPAELPLLLVPVVHGRAVDRALQVDVDPGENDVIIVKAY
jgi:hypothetical protein